MEDLKGRIEELLATSFRGATVELEVPYDDRVGGVLTWEEFDGRPQLQRQKKLWKVLLSKLNRTDQSRITAIMTMSPAEMAAIREF